MDYIFFYAKTGSLRDVISRSTRLAVRVPSESPSFAAQDLSTQQDPVGSRFFRHLPDAPFPGREGCLSDSLVGQDAFVVPLYPATVVLLAPSPGS